MKLENAKVYRISANDLEIASPDSEQSGKSKKTDRKMFSQRYECNAPLQ
jgi:hypothetical protein